MTIGGVIRWRIRLFAACRSASWRICRCVAPVLKTMRKKSRWPHQQCSHRHSCPGLLSSHPFAQKATRLAFPQLGVKPVLFHQRVVRALFDNAAPVQHDDPVESGDGGEPVRHGDNRLVLHQPLKIFLNHRFDLRIQRRCCLIEDEDRRILQHHPGDGDALALAAGELYAPLAHHSVIAGPAFRVGHIEDELMRRGALGRRDDFLFGDVAPPIGDVVADRAVHQHRLLAHHAELCAALPA